MSCHENHNDMTRTRRGPGVIRADQAHEAANRGFKLALRHLENPRLDLPSSQVDPSNKNLEPMESYEKNRSKVANLSFRKSMSPFPATDRASPQVASCHARTPRSVERRGARPAGCRAPGSCTLRFQRTKLPGSDRVP